MSNINFAEILEAADQFPPNGQEELIRILHNRLQDRKRAELMTDVTESWTEFQFGNCQLTNPQELMEELLG